MTDADILARELAPIETRVALRRLFSGPATLSGGEDTSPMLELIRNAWRAACPRWQPRGAFRLEPMRIL